MTVVLPNLGTSLQDLGQIAERSGKVERRGVHEAERRNSAREGWSRWAAPGGKSGKAEGRVREGMNVKADKRVTCYGKITLAKVEKASKIMFL